MREVPEAAVTDLTQLAEQVIAAGEKATPGEWKFVPIDHNHYYTHSIRFTDERTGVAHSVGALKLHDFYADAKNPDENLNNMWPLEVTANLARLESGANAAPILAREYLRLRKEMEDAPVVIKCEHRSIRGWWKAESPEERNGACEKCTHRARLVRIEKLEVKQNG